FAALRGVDLLLHAGDVGELWVLDQLSAVAPVVAVHGNDDTADAQHELPYQQVVTAAGRRILLTHAHYPDRTEELASRRHDSWEPVIARRLAFARSAGAPIVVFGHTHVPMAIERAGVLLVNPGAIAAPNPFERQLIQSVALLYLGHSGATSVVHVNLAEPDRPLLPNDDLDGGFMAVYRRYCEPIMRPELRAILSRALRGEAGVDTALAQAVLLRAAHRCWAGDKDMLTPDDLLAELWAAPHVAPDARAALEQAIADATHMPARPRSAAS
ncbi:MAG: YfcE family phosphodiesterase, partial [Chloroflexales bacterium]|nr:YfcE family phosphodiesterase [Chloroflexales bacterium]